MGPKLFSLLTDPSFLNAPESLKYDVIADLLLIYPAFFSISHAQNKFCEDQISKRFQLENQSIKDFSA